MINLPIGIDDYKTICDECFYADKTLLIKEIIDLPSGSVTLYTRPRRFGKSLNMSMLKAYFTISEDNIRFFENKKIYTLGQKYTDKINSLPVISFSLSNITGHTKQEIITKFKSLVSDLYCDFKDIVFPSLNDLEKTKYLSIINQTLDDVLYTDAIFDLSKYVSNFYNKKCVLLIDEYDQPLQIAFDEGFFDDIQLFFKAVFSKTLKSNPNIEKGVIFGVTEITKSSIFSGLNSILVNTFLGNNSDEFFGFTESYVKTLLSYFNKQNDYELLQKWYGGYSFSNREIFNPWSTLLYLKNNSLELYWTNTGSNVLISSIIENNTSNINDYLPSLLLSQTVVSNVDLSLSYVDINTSSTALVSFLLSAGYLTIASKISVGQYILKFPNEEIRQLFKKEISDRFIPSNNLSLLYLLQNSIKANDTQTMQSLLENYLLSSFSYYDFSSEKNYQIFMLTICTLLFEDYIVTSEVNSGKGRCDIIIYSKKQQLGMVIEIKYSKTNLSKDRLNAIAEKALVQIKEKNYTELLYKQNQKHIIIYGLGFSNKKVIVKSEILL